MDSANFFDANLPYIRWLMQAPLHVTFLGTGTSQGVPVIACNCRVCSSHDPHDKRLRTSVLIRYGDTCLVIDTGPDFRQQMLRAGVSKLDAIVYTHSHKDHLAGLDDVRAFNHFQKGAVDIFAHPDTQQSIRQEFSYIFSSTKYPGIPEIRMSDINHAQPFSVGNVHLLPIEVMHYHMRVLGFRIGDFTYITDANYISSESKELARGSKVLVLNALRREKHISHFTLTEAVAIAKELQAEQTYLTHISHQLGRHREVEEELPPGINLAFDMLSIQV